MLQLLVRRRTFSEIIKKSSLERFTSPTAEGIKVYSLRVGKKVRYGSVSFKSVQSCRSFSVLRLLGMLAIFTISIFKFTPALSHVAFQSPPMITLSFLMSFMLCFRLSKKAILVSSFGPYIAPRVIFCSLMTVSNNKKLLPGSSILLRITCLIFFEIKIPTPRLDLVEL